MDDALNQLENCEKLSLSTNQIPGIINLPRLKNLKILSLGRNNIRRIVGLDEIGQTLEQLWLSYNQIEKLEGLTPCVVLHTIFLGNNRVKSWDEVGKLSQLASIKSVLLIGNPIYNDKTLEEACPFVVKRIPQIEQVDAKMVSAA